MRRRWKSGAGETATSSRESAGKSMGIGTRTRANCEISIQNGTINENTPSLETFTFNGIYFSNSALADPSNIVIP